MWQKACPRWSVHLANLLVGRREGAKLSEGAKICWVLILKSLMKSHYW